ncbi:TnsD family Tn7-like transposition protein [Vibrio hangzhouensis]|uniref:Tn7-like transposition protein D n=1 Tax=Vibrio hangzhouensis TaxID=462991 RepID=A0A1H5TL18_9VIBR|nr:TnsD family Tn7-like transposition protein [Vibrio hangzhouensis]SEF62717.1 Tn7-like transposition protein D [Vibrio hangzhouensis]
MLAHFPVAQKDELLTSILARFIQQIGIKDNKVALDILFGNRMVVPSPFLQGHITQLLDHVGHVWGVHPRLIVERHTHLPLFKPFLSPNRFKTLQADLIYRRANPSMSRAGIPASVIQWPTCYKICPQCWQEQSKTLGFTYWQRLFQTPGVNACPLHQCLLLDTLIPIHSSHRHQFVGASCYQCQARFSEAANPCELKLSAMVEMLINSKLSSVSFEQWTLYYQKLARDAGMMIGSRIDHKEIADSVRRLWSDKWLNQQGLALCGENTWLLAMFRKHRRVFSYLQHFIVWLSLRGSTVDLLVELNLARAFPKIKRGTPKMRETKNIVKRDKSRTQWLGIVESSQAESLKKIRTTVLGARLYSWLYRYDREWLNAHKPNHASNYQNYRVDWQARDRHLVKSLIDIKNKTEGRIEDPRHSKSWFIAKIAKKSMIEKKLYKLPLCSLFFDRYSESVEEYQIRRLSRVMVQFIECKNVLRPLCEIERLAGLSHQRCRKPAREVLRLDIPAWQRAAALS